MPSKVCVNKLKREMRDFISAPPPHVPAIHVNERNLLGTQHPVTSSPRCCSISALLKERELTVLRFTGAEWHFLIEGPPDTPYAGVPIKRSVYLSVFREQEESDHRNGPLSTEECRRMVHWKAPLSPRIPIQAARHSHADAKCALSDRHAAVLVHGGCPAHFCPSCCSCCISVFVLNLLCSAERFSPGDVESSAPRVQRSTPRCATSAVPRCRECLLQA